RADDRALGRSGRPHHHHVLARQRRDEQQADDLLLAEELLLELTRPVLQAAGEVADREGSRGRTHCLFTREVQRALMLLRRAGRASPGDLRRPSAGSARRDDRYTRSSAALLV